LKLKLREGKKTAGPIRKARVQRSRAAAALTHARRAVTASPFDGMALAAALLVAALFTGYNMFRYPNYELDEGTYMGSAWAMFGQGKLYNYTYTYDHPLLGWFQIGAFSELVGGFLAFGSSINTGRVLMLAVAVLSTLLVFSILRRASGRATAALFGAVVFAVSPLGVGLHRQVWLDNLMTLWLLVSLYALIAANGRLWRIVVSALAFGLAFWSKEIAVVFLPGMFYLAYVVAHPVHRHFAFTLWGVATAAAMSFFFLLATLKDELLPPGVLWSSPEPHVSLIETFSYQLSRVGNGSFFSLESDFRTYFGQWMDIDPFTMLGGLAAAGIGLLFFRSHKFFFGVSLLTLSFILLLGRGGVVLYFYVIPLLALLALALGLLAGHMMGVMGAMGSMGAKQLGAARLRPGLAKYPAVLAILGLTAFLGIEAVPANYVNFTGDSTSSQNAATRWVAENLPNESVIFMDAYPWADLRAEELVGDEPFENAHYPLTALQDPSIYGPVLQTPGNVDYLLYSPTNNQSFSWIDGQLNEIDLPLVSDARESSDNIRTFTSEDWEMNLLRVRNLHQIEAPDNPMLSNTWEGYKERFIENGRVIDPKADQTTSEGQAYAMLRAVFMDDREAFDEIWGWTQENLQPNSNSLPSWKYGQLSNGTQGVTDPSTATDADTDTALALLFAARKFDAPGYKEEALAILTNVWEEETTMVGSDSAGYKRVAVAGDWARGDGTSTVARPMINPSYLSPYAYKIFAEADPEHPWDDVVDSSYEILQNIQASPELGGEAGVVPNWVALDPATGDPGPAGLEGLPTDEFSFDASRVPWRIGLDYMWFQDDRALDVLENLTLPREEIESEGRLFASHTLDGEPTVDYEATSAYAGVLPGLLVGGDPALAHRIFAEKVLGTYNNGPGEADAYWGEDPDDYYNQNMAWFATAVMDGSMGNLYADEEAIYWEATTIEPSLAGRGGGG
jgi:endo-1,4-beta-D-glucanase Y/4-amino-4-deoxy-L-arabinose transferase-like glycosyltransferase